MNKKIEETLSALVDDEINDFELKVLLQELENSSDNEKNKFFEKWNYLNSFSGLIKKINNKKRTDRVLLASSNFYIKVRKHISDHAIDQSSIKWRNLAVAASVTLVTILSLKNIGPYEENNSNSFIVDSNLDKEKKAQLLIEDNLNRSFISSPDVAILNKSSNLRDEEKKDELHNYLLKQHDSLSEEIIKKNAQHADFKKE